jgi:hypothetical protein
VIDRPSPGGSAGIGIDVTESEAMRAELARMTERIAARSTSSRPRSRSSRPISA